MAQPTLMRHYKLMRKSNPTLHQVACMAVTHGPGMLSYHESWKMIHEWVEHATVDDLDALFELILVSASLEDYDEGEDYDEVIAHILTLWMKKAPDEVLARLQRITIPPAANRSLMICVMDSIQRPECFPYLSDVAQDVDNLSDDDALKLGWALAYTRAPESVSVLERLQCSMAPRFEDALEDLPSCIIVARQRSSPSWTPEKSE